MADGSWAGIDAPVMWCVKGNTEFVPHPLVSVYISSESDMLTNRQYVFLNITGESHGRV
jgi:hypothetical protein